MLLRRIEQTVIGADFGADGYTTRAQADELASLTSLGPGRELLDIGCGRGWPGLYLALTTGCSVVGADVPFAGLIGGSGRAADEAVGDRALFVASRGEKLPFRTASFDAVIHSDTLC